MGKKIYNSLDVAGLETLASDPVSNLFEGRVFWDTTTKALKIYDGSTWQSIVLSPGVFLTRPDLTVRELKINNNDELEIHSV